MTQIHIIDDTANRHLQHTELLNNLKTEGFTGVTCNNTDEAKINARASTTPDHIWHLTSTVDLNSIFLVDFDLNFDSQEIISARKRLMNLLLECKDATLNQGVNARLMEAESKFTIADKYFAAVFVCAVLKTRKIPAIVISSAAFHSAEPLARFWELEIPASASETAWHGWKAEILKLVRHPIPEVCRVLCAYNLPIVKDPDAWWHDWCGEEHGIRSGRAVLSIQSFDAGNIQGSEIPENKAFHERAKGDWKFENPDCLVSGDTLKSALAVFGIKCSVTASLYRFPVSPGLAFLISLKELLRACLNDKGKGAPKQVEFFSFPPSSADPLVCGVRIEFPDSISECSGLGLMDKFLRKTKSSGTDAVGPIGGLSGAVWNLGHCRSENVRTNGDAWAEMFSKGSSYWVAWPCFEHNALTFRWGKP